MGWNVIEAFVAIWAGGLAGSIALVGFGLDSVIEVIAASVLIWRLRCELTCGQDTHAHAEGRAQRAWLIVPWLVISGCAAQPSLTFALVDRWGPALGEAGALDGPIGVAIGPDGSVYVSDSGHHRIVRFSAMGDVLGTFGREGSASGQLDRPMHIATDAAGRLYVADFYNHRVQVFSATGRWLGAFGRYGTGPGEFDRPTDVAVASDGTVYVVDFGNNRLQLFRAAPSL